MTDYSNLIVGKQIKKYRTARNLTQKELAEKVDISPSLIGNIEIGGCTKNSSMSMKHICKIAEVLGVSLDDLAYTNIECKQNKNTHSLMDEIEREIDSLPENYLNFYNETIHIFKQKKNCK